MIVHLKRILLTGFILFSGLAFGAFLANHLIPASVVYEENSSPFSLSVFPVPNEAPPNMSTSSLSTDTVMCTMDAKVCPDGSYVGRVGPRCEFAACPSENEGEALEVQCSEEMKRVDSCIEIYAPVCASVQVECTTTPCDPVPQTFQNSCFACMSDRVDSYIEGECLIPLTVS
jgi:hypothetical protein